MRHAIAKPGGGAAFVVADRLVAFIESARRSLDLAIYDAHFEGTDAQGRVQISDQPPPKGTEGVKTYGAP